MSLKAGCCGLNLVAASHIIMFDPSWNAYDEEQAIHRAYRIGQTKPVKVHRLLITNTIEARILELQEKKKDLIDTALNGTAEKSKDVLSKKDLKFLFVGFQCP